jgi:hypothetical protein
MPQMVAHHTAGGCSLRPGDLLGTGTLSHAVRVVLHASAPAFCTAAIVTCPARQRCAALRRTQSIATGPYISITSAGAGRPGVPAGGDPQRRPAAAAARWQRPGIPTGRRHRLPARLLPGRRLPRRLRRLLRPAAAGAHRLTGGPAAEPATPAAAAGCWIIAVRCHVSRLGSCVGR